MRAEVPVLLAGMLALVACTHRLGDVIPVAEAGSEYPGAQVRVFRGNISGSDLVGAYRFSNGYWKSELHLAAGGKFAVIEISDELEITATETKLRTYARAAGDWVVTNDGTIAFKAPDYKAVYVPVIVAGSLGLIEAKGGTQHRRVFVRTRRPLTKGP